MDISAFIEAYDKAPFDLIDEKAIPLIPQVAGHAETLMTLLKTFLEYEQTQGTLQVFPLMPFVRVDSANRVTEALTPDLMGIATERLERYKSQRANWRDLPLLLVPDFCVDVAAPSDRLVAVENKINAYFRQGVQAVWLVNSCNVYVNIYMPGGRAERLTIDEMLDGGALIPGFVLPLRDLFMC